MSYLRRASLLLALLMLMAAFTVQAQDNPPTPIQLDESDLPPPPTKEATPIELDESDLPPLPTKEVTPDDSDLIVPIPPGAGNPTVEPPPNMEIPTAGLWSYRYGTGNVSGDCDNGSNSYDNGGPDRDYYDANDPSNQAYICTWPAKGVVLVNSDTFRASKVVQPATYMTSAVISSYDSSSQQRTLIMEDKTHFTVKTVTKYGGTCQVENVVHYELVKPGAAWGCQTTLPPKDEPAQDEQNPQPTPAPTEEESTIIDPPRVMEGQYTIQWLPFDATCKPSVTPTFQQVTLGKSSEEDVVLIINGEKFNLTGDRLRGEYTMYASSLSVTLQRRFADDFNMSWQTTSPDKKDSCYAKGLMSLSQPLSADQRTSLRLPTPIDPGPIDLSGNTSSGSTSDLPPTQKPSLGTYSVKWEPMAQVCTAETTKWVPDFTEANLKENPDGSYTLETSKASYPLNNMLLYMKSEPSGISEIMTMSVDGSKLMGSYNAYDANGKMCSAMVTFEAK
jgi:hypothetical protein